MSEATAPPSRASSSRVSSASGQAAVGEVPKGEAVSGEGANQGEVRPPGRAHSPAHARHPEGPLRGTCGPWELVVAFLAFLGLALALFHAAWAHPFSTQIGGAGDADEYDWFLSWMPFALGHAHDPLISHYVNFPSGINLMWNT